METSFGTPVQVYSWTRSRVEKWQITLRVLIEWLNNIIERSYRENEVHGVLVIVVIFRCYRIDYRARRGGLVWLKVP